MCSAKSINTCFSAYFIMPHAKKRTRKKPKNWHQRKPNKSNPAAVRIQRQITRLRQQAANLDLLLLDARNKKKYGLVSELRKQRARISREIISLRGSLRKL